MILIGQYDSPFVRRVGIALRLYGLPFEHRPWSVFGDGDKLRALNPLMRVPTLVLDDGFVLTDSHMMLDYLDSLVPPREALFPRAEPARHRALKVAALGTGLAEKAVALFYEGVFHRPPSAAWRSRCTLQIGSVLAALEAERARQTTPFWFARLTHADIALTCALRFVTDAHPGIFTESEHPALTRYAAEMGQLPVFSEIFQPFVPPA
jgi:glutathione S-transferase